MQAVNSAGLPLSMPRYVAFLRAINVGGHTVTMGRLVELFESLELDDISTFIASGNVLFTSRAKPVMLERQIDRHLHAELGYPAEAFVRSIADLQLVLKQQVFAATEVAASHALMIGFLRAEPTREVVAAIERLSGSTDKLAIRGRELHWLRTVQESDPKLARQLEKAIGGPMTVRNVNTVRRIVEKYRDR
jgi:uncharacterized protein (DUF1697 family)